MIPCSGVVARFPLLSGVVASTVFLGASFLTLAVCLVPSLRWQYGNTGVTAPTTGTGPRTKVLQGEKRTRKRSLKRSGSVSHVKLEVSLCVLRSNLHSRFLTYFRITKVVSPQPKRCPMRYAVDVLWCRTRFPKVIDIFPSHSTLFTVLMLSKFETALSLYYSIAHFRAISVRSHRYERVFVACTRTLGLITGG
jgi:hypothetical protein